MPGLWGGGTVPWQGEQLLREAGARNHRAELAQAARTVPCFGDKWQWQWLGWHLPLVLPGRVRGWVTLWWCHSGWHGPGDRALCQPW